MSGDNQAPTDGHDGSFKLTDEQKSTLELEHNIAVTAGAGTGKTTALTERYLSILEGTAADSTVDSGVTSDTDPVGASPEEILTITFTNDAANEMLDRIREAVGKRLEAASAGDYERWRRIKDDLEDGYIHTIHGFCARLLREHVVTAPVHPEFEVADETDAKALGSDVVSEFVGRRLAAGDDDVGLLARLWRRETLEEMLVELLGKRPTSENWVDRWRDADVDDYADFLWEQIHPIGPGFADETFADPSLREALAEIRTLHAAGVVDDVDPAADRGSRKVRAITDLLEEYRPLIDEADTRARQRFLDEACDLLTTNDGTRHGHDWWYWGSASRWSDAGREAEQERLETAIEAFFTTVDPASLEFGTDRDETAAYYVLALARTFDGVLDAYEKAKQRRNLLDYNDLVETAIQVLEDNPRVGTRLREQFEYVMMDEVQDTDRRQWRLVKLLTGDDPETYDAQNVFLVGDEKQSIYRFRGADVTTFATARQELATANPETVETSRDLTGNFRTTDETVVFVNDLFDQLFESPGDDRADYEATSQDLTTRRQAGQAVTGTCEYLCIPDDDYPELHGPGYLEETPEFVESGEREAHAIAARLTRLFDDPPDVYDEDDDTYREANSEDAAILLRSRTRLKAYERALDAVDVPYTVVSGTGFYDTPEVTALTNLLRVLANPRDERALFGVLRSPLFGIPDDDIARLRLGADHLWDGLATADGDLGDAVDCLEAWRRLAGAGPDPGAESATHWGTLVSRVVDDTGFIASIAGDERPRQAAVNVNRFREQLRAWEEAGVKTAAGMMSRLDRRRDLESNADEATIPEDTDGVEIRTIHSAKGLEFPIVVVPELGTQFNFRADVDSDGRVYLDELSLQEGSDREPVLGIKSPSHEEAFVTEDTLVRQVTRDRVEAYERAELKRLLYVATTRTRDHLLLSGIHEFDETDGEFPLADPGESGAMRWRDWTQPALLDSEATPRALREAGVWDATLPHSTCRVTRPERSKSDWQADPPQKAPSLDLDVSDIDVQETQQVTTASSLPNIVANGEAGHDTGTGRNHQDGESGGDLDLDLDRGVLGTIVHRLCERRPNPDRWSEFAHDIADQEDEVLADADLERIQTHARRAIAFVDGYEDDLDHSLAFDERPVAARFDDIQIVGDIDRLTVTPETFHVIDYKTNSMTGTSADELAEYYWPQLRAYAAALHQADPTRDAQLVLYFTEPGEERTDSISAVELDGIADETVEIVRSVKL